MNIQTDSRTSAPLAERFKSQEAKILEYALSRVGTYDSSECKERLKNRISNLEDSVKMRFHPTRNRLGSASFKSKICMPLVREKYLGLRGMTFASFRNDPMITVLPEGDTPYPQAEVAGMALAENLRKTKFRRKAWRRMVQNGCSTGVAVTVARYRQTIHDGAMKTVYGQIGFDRIPMPAEARHHIVNTPVHPLNYIQNPMIADPKDSDYRGWREKNTLAQLKRDVSRDGHYIKRNLKKVISGAMDEVNRNPQKYGASDGPMDWGRVGMDIIYLYTTLPIEGNEDDDTTYYLEIVGDKIIRFEANQNDENLVPISVLSFEAGDKYWWGNTPIENSVPMENFLNHVLGIRSDQAMRTLERTLFFDTSLGVDMAALNNRKRNGGYVPFNSKGRAASEVFYDFQPRDTTGNSFESVIREIKEADQRVSFESDYNRAPTQGGPQNETATAAIMMDEKGNTLKSDILESWSYGLLDMAEADLVLMQQMYPERFELKPDRGPQISLHKSNILGYYEYRTVSSLTQNKITRMTNLLNFMTALVNFRGTGDPAFMQVQMPQIIKSWMKQYDLPYDLDEVYPDAPAQAAMPGQAGAQGVGPMPLGEPPTPAPGQNMEVANVA